MKTGMVLIGLSLLVTACANPGQLSAGGGGIACQGPGGVYHVNGSCLAGDSPLSPFQSAATTPPTPKRPQTSVKPTSASTSPDGECSEYVRSGGKGVSVPDLVKQVSSLSLKKDEFETTAAYEARKTAAPSRLSGALQRQANGRVAVTVPVHQSAMKYDADRGILDIGGDASIVPVSSVSAGGVYQTVIITDDVGNNNGSYVGQNAYGAKAKVLKINEQINGVVVDSRGSIVDAGYWPSRGFRVPEAMSPNEARAAKQRLRVLVLGDLRDPYLIHDISGSTPTIHAPMDRTIETTAITMTVACYAIYDPGTKKVIWASR